MTVKLDTLFWFYKDFSICRDRLQQFRNFNPESKVFGLFGGNVEDAEEAKHILGDLLHDFYVFPQKKPALWKWRHGDQMIIDWYQNRGKYLEWDSLFVLQWDMLVLDSLEKLFSELKPGQVVLSGCRPKSEVESWWPWVLPPHKDEMDRYSEYLKSSQNYNAELYVCLFIIACFPRKFLSEYADIGNTELGFLEYKIPTIANHLGFSFYSNAQTEPWWAKDPMSKSAQDSEKVLNAVSKEIPLDVIKSELSKDNGRRVFHPYYSHYPPRLSVKNLFKKFVGILGR